MDTSLLKTVFVVPERQKIEMNCTSVAWTPRYKFCPSVLWKSIIKQFSMEQLLGNQKINNLNITMNQV